MRVRPPLLVANALLATVFVFFAWMQRNDIDPAIYHHPSVIDATLWFAFYLLVGGLFLVVCFRTIPKWLLAVAAIACLVELGLTAPGLYENFFGENEFTMTQVSMSAEDPRVELSREFFGALIALAGVAFLAWQNRASPPMTRDP